MENVWQSTQALSRISTLFHQSLLTDIAFLVGSSKEKISAHKAILSSGSPVFHTMFYGSLPEINDEIEIPDIQPEIFRALLRYFYSDELPDVRIALPVWYAANKYMVTPLMVSCRRILKYSISLDNVLQVFQEALNFQEEDLMIVCFYLMCENTSTIFQSAFFISVDRKTLKKLFSSSQLTVEELDIYNMCIKWANAQCIEMGLEITPPNIRIILGNILFVIRFPLMSIEDFAHGPAQSGILTEKECSEVFLYLLSEQKPDNMPFSIENRKCVVLPLIARTFLNNPDHSGIITSIKFQVNIKLLLIAIDFYVRDDYPSQIIRVTLENQNLGEPINFLFNIVPFSSGKSYMPLKLDSTQLTGACIQPHQFYTLKLILIEEQNNSLFAPYHTLSLDDVNFTVSIATKEMNSIMAPALLFKDENAVNRPLIAADSLEIVGLRFYKYQE